MGLDIQGMPQSCGLVFGGLSADLYKTGFNSNIAVARAENEWETEIKSPVRSAILGQLTARHSVI
jgi:hypothetical protein